MDHLTFAQLLGNYGEFAGALAVVATLGYLALQIRQNNKSVSRESYLHWMSELNKVLLEKQQNPEFMELFQRANLDWNSLSHRDKGVMSAVYSQVLVSCEAAFMLRKQGFIDPGLDTSLLDKTIVSFIQIPGVHTWWSTTKVFYNSVFQQYVEDSLKADDCAPPLHQTLPWYVEVNTNSVSPS